MKNCKLQIQQAFSRTRFSKIIVYQNPLPFKLFLERINPEHIGVIWGKRRKRTSKGNNRVKVAKVYFEVLPVVIGIAVMSYCDNALVLLSQVCNMSLIVALSVSFIYYGILLKLGMRKSLLA